MTTLRSLSIVFLALAGVVGCEKLFGKKEQPVPEEPPPPPVVSARVPPTIHGATPLNEFADAALESPDGKTALEQARIYEARGQLWIARLVIEKKAEGPNATPAEIEFLAYLCHRQDDTVCVEECGFKLGRKLKFDGGPPKSAEAPPPVHREPESDLARARDHVLQDDLDAARKILEPKVLDGKASKEELRLLRTVCEKQGDRMCVVLCDTKLR